MAKDITVTQSYIEGVTAFQEGKPNSDNPYPMGSEHGMNNDRYRWFMGWYDTKYKKIYERTK